jgi:glycerol-3-phosphate dehydrogenase (NAD(P)+)
VKAVVVGAGSWGSAFATVLRGRGHDVTIACRDAEQARVIAATGRNPRYLRSADLTGIAAADLKAAPVADADLVAVSVPSRSYGEVVRSLPGDAPILTLTKGLDPATGNLLHTLVEGRPVAVLSGPTFAEEIASGLPCAAVIASRDEALAESLQHEITSPAFRVYVNADLTGVEFCGAAKNVIALAAGGVDGLDLGDNAKAAVITRGVAEMTRLGSACGARPETFAGLAGMGDLMVTCWSDLGRNRRAGELIARGASPEQAVAEIGQVVEGLTAAPVLRDLSRRLGIELPITEAVCGILDGQSLPELAASLQGRSPRGE